MIAVQQDSYDWLIKKGLPELFAEFSPIKDYSEKKFELYFDKLTLEAPKFDERHAIANQLSYDAPLKVTVKLKNKVLGQEREQEVFLADFPVMTNHGTFIVNGNERVVVPQLARSYGVFFTETDIRAKRYFGAKIIPSGGAWIELQTEPDDVIYVRIDRRRKFPVSTLLRVFADIGGQSLGREGVLALFRDVPSAVPYMETTVARDSAETVDDCYLDVYRRLRDSDLATTASAREFVTSLFGREKYDLSVVGRLRLDNRFAKSPNRVEGNEEIGRESRVLTLEDLQMIIAQIIKLNNDPHAVGDDIDHLGLRRVRCVGEMLQQKLRIGLIQMRRNIQDRMSTVDSSTTLPITLLSPRPLQARLKEFFNTNQLSQFMSQKNVLSEVEHLRRLSALGPGGLTRKRSGLEVRDVHTSHYGRVCPIHTPEGPNIGLILQLSNYARVNRFGSLETPYRRVRDGAITEELVFLGGLEEENYAIAHASVPYDDQGRFLEKRVEVRLDGRPTLVPRERVDFIDVAPYQAFSLATALIPFLEHDDANRALMGSNMQKQAIPCLRPEAPLVATGMEALAVRDSGRIITARRAGVVDYVSGQLIKVKTDSGEIDEYRLVIFSKTNDNTVFHQRPVVAVGERVKRGALLADTSSSAGGELAVGQNVRVAFMSWRGANYEDAIIISERLVREQIFSSIHIEEFKINVRETKLGPEVTTHDIPNVGEAKLRNLDEEGIVRVGAEVEPNDILVGKITPKGETELTAEERLLRSIFGEKARDVKDTSKRLPHGKKGKVVGVRVFSRERGDRLESGITKRIHIEVAEIRNISVGDKLCGRHGNKGVIARILPIEDMPYQEDGTPVDVILTPLGVPSRMNLGQVFEMHLGLAAERLGYQAITPSFTGATDEEIKQELVTAGVSANGKVRLYDGLTGMAFDQPVAVGVMYILKLDHMVEDKLHMRSIGPYSLITQQPLGGKASRGGQRFGEMEVWALEGYGASYTLQEMLTIKSDDIAGRSQAFDSIIKGESIRPPNLPASFHVMLNELRGLALDVDLK